MTDHTADRRGELIAAALVGELTADEAAEFERMRASDPTIDAELTELRVLTGQVSGRPEWLDATPSDGLRDAVLTIGAADGGVDSREFGDEERDDRAGGLVGPDDADGPTGAPGSADAVDSRNGADEAGGRGEADEADAEAAGAAPVTPLRRPRFGGAMIAGIAAVGLVVGVVGGFFLPRPETPTPVGDPGTLGAVEPVDFQGEPVGVEIDGSVVAHTWGTETLLTVNGLPSGEFYSVVVVDAAGEDVGSGTFLGSEVEIICAVNAAALREEVTSVEIREESGDVVASAALPRVEG
ncbi:MULTISPECIES: hypothetical protein [unclassified Pseudoclavibacter]|uniref:hypothetical protein n=1 Tax=unclassified Pseudoclavibacter TaxID=2615177 RepID=UPI001BAD243C|nr:hypothetical protein [Pseudoclavibacter sp. Marseille-Q4354]MBS3179915.1 hypothetical protein [Pseudoclavibacter sp. Marseille-Q4354]